MTSANGFLIVKNNLMFHWLSLYYWGHQSRLDPTKKRSFTFYSEPSLTIIRVKTILFYQRTLSMRTSFFNHISDPLLNYFNNCFKMLDFTSDNKRIQHTSVSNMPITRSPVLGWRRNLTQFEADSLRYSLSPVQPTREHQSSHLLRYSAASRQVTYVHVCSFPRTLSALQLNPFLSSGFV